MFKAFSGALALVLALLVLNWAFPELAQVMVEVALKLLKLISAVLDLLLSKVPVQ